MKRSTFFKRIAGGVAGLAALPIVAKVEPTYAELKEAAMLKFGVERELQEIYLPRLDYEKLKIKSGCGAAVRSDINIAMQTIIQKIEELENGRIS